MKRTKIFNNKRNSNLTLMSNFNPVTDLDSVLDLTLAQPCGISFGSGCVSGVNRDALRDVLLVPAVPSNDDDGDDVDTQAEGRQFWPPPTTATKDFSKFSTQLNPSERRTVFQFKPTRHERRRRATAVSDGGKQRRRRRRFVSKFGRFSIQIKRRRVCLFSFFVVFSATDFYSCSSPQVSTPMTDFRR